MSIIEKTLDKLERSANYATDNAASNVTNNEIGDFYQLHAPRYATNSTRPLKLFFLLFTLLFATAIFVINQGLDFKISFPEELTLENKTIEKTILATPTTKIVTSTQDELNNSLLQARRIQTQTQINPNIKSELQDTLKKLVPEVNIPLFSTNNKTRPVSKKLTTTVIPLVINKEPILNREIKLNTVEPPVIQTRVKKARVTRTQVTPPIERQTSLLQLTLVIPKHLKNGNYDTVIRLLQKHRNKLLNTWEYYYWQSQRAANPLN